MTGPQFHADATEGSSAMQCERCGCTAYDGRGEPSLHDFCEFCSRNLCDRCMEAGTCPDSPDKKHEAYREDDEDLAERTQ